MSTISAVIKGFAITAIATVITLMVEFDNAPLVLVSIASTVALGLLDSYYLSIERKFRHLYERVRTKDCPADYSLELTDDPVEIIRAKTNPIACISSRSIAPFYLFLAALQILTALLLS